MKLYPLVISLIFLGCGSPKLVQIPDLRCGQPCYGGNPANAGKGVCNLGFWNCDDGGEIVNCSGWGAPQTPVCPIGFTGDSGVDYECTGAPYNCPCQFGATKACYDGNVLTENVGICHSGTQVCQNGVWSNCQGEQLPEPEQCNCQDNNCDGIIGDIPTQFCYDGPQNTVGVGECRPGITKCSVSGSCSSYCSGEITPEPPGSNICGGPDVECSGKTVSTTALTDVVFIVDNSTINCENTDGLQLQDFQAIQNTITSFISQYNQSNFRYALIETPGCSDPSQTFSSSTEAGYIITQPLTDEVTCSNAVSNNQCMANVCADPDPIEPSTLLLEQINGQLIPWDQGAQKNIVLFTGDEDFDSCSQISQLSQKNNVTNLLFIGWYNILTYQGCSNLIFNIAGEAQMLNELNQNLTFPCTDGG